jgi:ABC-2 type transport system permease protein
MKATLTIARREFRSYFDSPLAYVVICVGLTLLGFVFFYMGGGFWQADRASLQQLFAQVPRGLSFLVIPVITMRLVAEERRSGTLEMLITLPVKDHEVVLGKFLGAWGLVLVLVGATALYPLMMFRFPWHLGALDAGPVWCGYLGLVVYSAAAVAVGLFISSLTESQVIAFFTTFVILFVLHMLGSGLTLRFLPPKAEWVATFVSFDSRLTPFVRGLIQPRDVIYFLSITAAGLMGSFWALERRKWA